MTYALWVNRGNGGCAERYIDGVFPRKTAMMLAAAYRKKSGEKVYARRIDIALTRSPKP